MSRIFIDESTLSAIGDAIRSKEGSEALIPTTEMAARIAAISGGCGTEVLVEANDFTNAVQVQEYFATIHQSYDFVAVLLQKTDGTANQCLVMLSLGDGSSGDRGSFFRNRNGAINAGSIVAAYDCVLVEGTKYVVFTQKEG